MQNDKKRMKKKIFEVLVCLVFAVAAVGCGARNSQEQKGVETEADSVNVALGKNDGRFVKVDTLESENPAGLYGGTWEQVTGTGIPFNVWKRTK